MTTLLQEIQAACTAEELLEGNQHTMAAKVNAARVAAGVKLVQTKMISERGVRAKLGPVVGSKFIRLLADLEAAAKTDSVPDWLTAILTAMSVPAEDHIYYLETLGCGYDWLRTADGLDLGDASVRNLLDLIAAGNPELTTGVVSLKAMAEQPAVAVTWQECAAALGA
jgi:hypothetical protein